MSIFHPYRSPLRYPGGKRKVAPYISRLIEANGLRDISYVEPYAGGGSIALALMVRTVVGPDLPQRCGPGCIRLLAALPQ